MGMDDEDVGHFIYFVEVNDFFISIDITPEQPQVCQVARELLEFFAHLFAFWVPNSPEENGYHLICK